MLSSPQGLSPLAAYEELMRFATKRGEAALRLALHASVPQGFKPDLLHLLKRNFVSEAGDDPTIEVDVLFSPLCEDLGRGYFRFDPHVRTLLLDNLASNYAREAQSRIYRVANFLLFYVDHFDRSTSENQDQLWRDYLEMQRWVAFAFVSPESAARQLAMALENADSTRNFAARMQLGGLASALATPLVGYRGLLNYAAGLQALELGNQREAEELLASLTEHDLKVGDTVLRPASKLMEEWHERNRTVSSSLRAEAEEVIGPEETASLDFSSFDAAVESLRSDKTEARLRAAQILADENAPASAVPALIEALKDADMTVAQAAIRALGVIGSEAAIYGLTEATQDIRNDLLVDATAELAAMRKGVVLILGRFTPHREAVLEAIRAHLHDLGYAPVFFGNRDKDSVAAVAYHSRFIIADITEPRGVRSQLSAVLPDLKIPVQPIVQGGGRIYKTFSELQHYSSLLKPHRYDGVSDLLSDLTETVIPSLESWAAEVGRLKPDSGLGRALVPGFEDDIFINYSHDDNRSTSGDLKGWVDTLHESLERRLTQLLGERPKIWRDSLLSGSEELADTLVVRLSKTAFTVSVISPSYVKSEWCRRELNEFYRRASDSGGIKIKNRSRIFKVIKTPIGEDPAVDPLAGSGLPRELSMLLQESLGYEFYEIDKMSGRVREFWPELGPEYQRKFLERLEDLAQDIKDFVRFEWDISKGVQRGKRVYLAETTPDLSEERNELRRMLQVHGYVVLPDESLPFNESVFEGRVHEYLAQSSFSIHLIGSDHVASSANEAPNSAVYQNSAKRIRTQHKLAMERGQDDSDYYKFIWIAQGLSARDKTHQLFIEYLQNDPSVYEGADVLVGASLEDLKTIIQKKLFERQPKPESASDGKRVYLICDKQDLEAVRPIRDYLFDQGFEVLLPFEDGTSVLSGHRENLRRCDAILVYYGSLNTVEYKLVDLRKSDALRDRPFKVKAIYVGGPETEDKRLFQTAQALVIKNFGEFTPASLRPFVDQFGEYPSPTLS